MAVFESIPTDLTVLVGGTLYAEWDFFQDDAFTEAFNLTGYALEVIIAPPGFNDTAAPVTLTDGSGLTLNLADGVVQMSHDSAGWEAGRGRWYLQATDPAGLVSFPLRGALTVGSP